MRTTLFRIIAPSLFTWLLLMPLFVLAQNSNFTKDTATINKLNRIAEAAQFAREIQRAEEFANKALDSSLLIGYEEGVARSLFTIGLSHQRNSKPNKALEFYRRSYSLAGTNLKLQANNLRNLGNCHNEIGNYDSAIVFFNKLLHLAVSNNLESEIARAYNNIGISLDSKGDLVTALEFYFKSLDIKTKLNDKKGMSSTYNNIGVVFHNQGDIPRAIEYFYKSLKIKEELGDKVSAAYLYNNIGVIYNDEKRYDEALDCYNKAYKIDSAIDNKRALATGLLNQGMLLHKLSKFDEALTKIKKSLAINQEIGAKQSEINSLFNLGEVYMSIGKTDSSKFLLRQAEKLCIETGDKRNLAIVNILLAQTHIKTKQYQLAIELASTALKIATEISTSSLQRDASEILAKAYEELGNHKESLYHFKNYITIRDTLSNDEKSKRIWQIQTQANFDKTLEAQRLKQEQEMASVQLETQRQTLLSRSFMLFTLLALIIAAVVFYYYRISKNLTISLQLQKQEIEQQKEEISAQRDEIDSQRNLVTMQRDRIMDLFTEISESVMYAQRIQQALFPSNIELDKLLGEHFAIIRPKQVVSGDFYWVAKSGNATYIAAVDCTGHGMPGAFMSMLGTTLLNELILQQVSCAPNVMLDHLREKVISTLSQTGQGEDNMDGMDIALLAFIPDTLQLLYAGANMPVWIVRQPTDKNIPPQIFELLPDRMPISHYVTMRPFGIQSFNLEKGDMVYMFTDGYADQFGGKKGKKYQISQLRNLLLNISHLPAKEQGNILTENFTLWQGDNFQIDDVLVMGFRV
jgi:tetratricopeptide (TPR) repeat protein